MTPGRRLAWLLVAATLSGCLGPSPSSPQDGSTNATNTTNTTNPLGGVGGNATAPLEVTLVDTAFQPATLNVTAGATVRFHNGGALLHSVVLQKEGGLTALTDQDVQPGTSATVTFGEAGAYLLRCKYHSSDFDHGMVGRVAVT